MNQQKTASGLDENVAAALTYSLGWLTGLGFLLTEPDNRFVRFHAMQSTIIFGVLSLVALLLQVVPLLGLLMMLFLVIPVSFILWLILIFKAYQGERFKFPIAGDIAEQKL